MLVFALEMMSLYNNYFLYNIWIQEDINTVKDPAGALSGQYKGLAYEIPIMHHSLHNSSGVFQEQHSLTDTTTIMTDGEHCTAAAGSTSAAATADFTTQEALSGQYKGLDYEVPIIHHSLHNSSGVFQEQHSLTNITTIMTDGEHCTAAAGSTSAAATVGFTTQEEER